MTIRLLRTPRARRVRECRPFEPAGCDVTRHDGAGAHASRVKVERLREQYQNGTLRVDVHEVARRMLIRLLA